MKIIKRYANRKYYDTEARGYTTLNELRGLVRNGIPFKVICYRTKNDITDEALLQCVATHSKLPTEMLISLIRY